MNEPTPGSVPTPEPRIAAFEKLGFGLFLHWGLYSQLGRGEWVQHLEKIPFAEYDKLKDTFTAKDFAPRAIARMAKQAGQKYITLTTRHHEGFSLYDTRGLSDFDAPHSPAGRDLIAEFVDGCRAEGIVPVFYHTTLDWRLNSQYCTAAEFDEYLDYLYASVEVLCTNYGPIGGMWFDGNWSRTDVDWKEDRLYSMIRKNQPDAMIVNNTGLQERGKAGADEIDSVTFEQGLPTAPDRSGWKKYLAGEMCQTLNQHWGIATNDFNYLSTKAVIETLCACRKVGANYLLNVGPTAEGAIPAYEQALLVKVGRWVEMAGTVVYDGKPTPATCTGNDFVLEADGKIYYFAHDLIQAGHENVTVGGSGGNGPREIAGLDRQIHSARWLDSGEELKVERMGDSATIDCTGYPYGTSLVVRIAEMF